MIILIPYSYTEVGWWEGQKTAPDILVSIPKFYIYIIIHNDLFLSKCYIFEYVKFMLTKYRIFYFTY